MKFAELEIVKFNVNDIMTSSKEQTSSVVPPVSSKEDDLGEEEAD